MLFKVFFFLFQNLNFFQTKSLSAILNQSLQYINPISLFKFKPVTTVKTNGKIKSFSSDFTILFLQICNHYKKLVQRFFFICSFFRELSLQLHFQYTIVLTIIGNKQFRHESFLINVLFFVLFQLVDNKVKCFYLLVLSCLQCKVAMLGA